MKQNNKQGGNKDRRNWNMPKSGNKQGKQASVTNAQPYRTGRGNKADRRAEEIIDTEEAGVRRQSPSNPLEYYTKFSRFAADAANLPFAMPLGVPISVNYSGYGATFSVPGIMRLAFTPTIGYSADFTSPINRSSTRFYTYLRANQKASANYDHQDITMMELALDSAYMFHAMCSRIYETANNVTPVNEYYVRSLLAAQCVSLADVSANMSDFRAWINTFAYNLGQFSMPKGITLFDRHRWMCENYYVDGETSKAQTYIFVPCGFWLYDNTVATGSQLTWKPFCNLATSGAKLQYTVAELMQFGNDLLNAIAGDEDFQYIAGDIYNFYGGDVYALPYIQENDIIVPKYDKTVLSQIENATIVGAWASNPSITQNPSVNQGAVIFTPAPTSAFGIDKTPMNFHWDSPDPGEVIEASRLTVAMTSDTSGIKIESCGTEVVNWLDVFAINPATGAPRYNSILSQTKTLTAAAVPTDYAAVFTDVLHLAQFDWAPCMVVLLEYTSGTMTYVGQTWDVDNYQWIDNDYIKWIHEACLWSLFEVGTNRTELS